MERKWNLFRSIKRVFFIQSKCTLPDGSQRRTTKQKTKKLGGKLRRNKTNIRVLWSSKPTSIEKILADAERDDCLVFKPPTLPEHDQPKTPTFVPPPIVAPPKLSTQKVSSPRMCSPRASSPRITSPTVSPRKIFSPRASSPKILSPRASSPKILSPRASSPKILSPRASSPKILSHRASSPKILSPRASSPGILSTGVFSPKFLSPSVSSPKMRSPVVSSPINDTKKEMIDRLESVTRIQSAYRGHIERRSFKALKGLVRLQGVIRGQNVRRQTASAIKNLQFLVHTQTQIQERRLHVMENEAFHEVQCVIDKETESTASKWSHFSEAGNQSEWDGSLLTKLEKEAKLQKKEEAMIKRERTIAYSQARQMIKAPASHLLQSSQSDMQSATGLSRWLKWEEGEPAGYLHEAQQKANSLASSIHSPIRTSWMDAMETSSTTPRSTKSRTGPPSSRNRTGAYVSPFDAHFKDDDSFASSHAQSVPGYLTPTASTKAKAKFNGDETRRLSFPLPHSSAKWGKASVSSSKDSNSPRTFDSH